MSRCIRAKYHIQEDKKAPSAEDAFLGLMEVMLRKDLR